MNFIEEPMRFGLFSGPYHRPDISPLMAFQQDMELIENLDRVGFDEVWIGEHHSGGVETIACPELMIAAAVGSIGTCSVIAFIILYGLLLVPRNDFGKYWCSTDGV